ncbi:MAG: DUF1499 domain-containing protein [Aestuariivirga sp.]|nr:DUF1499 domain-containing protein [Aestuariivirga sp.]
MRRILNIAALLAALSIAAFLIVGPERIWAQFGAADLGDVDFATLVRRDSPNDALACLPDVCAAKADIAAPLIAKPPATVFAAVETALSREPRVQEVAADAAQGTLRFVERSRLLGFPDTVNLKVVPTPDGGSAVLIYSRSQIGRDDMGVNLARVKRWAELIEAEAGR